MRPREQGVEDLDRTLRASPVFREGTPATLADLAARASRLDYPAGAFLFRQGEPAAHVFVLTAGEVAIVSPARAGAEQVYTIVRAGELIGELALLTSGRRTAGARATSPATAWAIAREAFWAFLEATPAASAALLRHLAERLANREALIDDLLSLDVKGRLAKALLGLAERHGVVDRDGTRIALRLTHRDLAGMVGASRENVSRALAGFRKRGFIDYDPESIRVLDQGALRRLT
ncbi:MAG TPA: Crp/Fnr family transcriptional regulator [Actinomycetes bacterium]|jgi:CRP-like cAMP-binding protein|nr:Crp/Fnr family transcriptional regulator [Actinomycetes bacterium]